MKKIYLAISDRNFKAVSETIRTVLPGSTYERLHDQDSVMKALNKPFLLCVAEKDFIEINYLNQLTLDGTLMIIIDSTETLSYSKENVVICQGLNAALVDLRISIIGNLTYDKKGPIPTKRKESSPPEFQPESKLPIERDSEENPVEANEENLPPETLQSETPPHEIEKAVDSTATSEDKTSVTTGESLKKKENLKKHPDESQDSKTEKVDVFGPLTEKALGIGKAMDLVSFKTKKTIGMWAPLSAGVTTFLIDFAIYLQEQQGIPVSVVELPKKNQHHFKILSRYKSKPTTWKSLIENLQTSDTPNHLSLWMYRGVRWFPLGESDLDEKYKRDKRFTDDFFLAVKRTEIVLVDLPTGDMDAATLDSLSHLDEIWIFGDNDFDRQYEHKVFIHNKLIKEHQLHVKLIHSRTTQKSRPQEVAKKLGLPLLCTVPNLFDLAGDNKYESKPLIDNSEAYKKLTPPFRLAAKSLLGEDFDKALPKPFWKSLKRKLLDVVDSI